MADAMRAHEADGLAAGRETRGDGRGAPVLLAIGLAGAVTLLAGAGIGGGALIAAAGQIGGEPMLVIVTAAGAGPRAEAVGPALRLLRTSRAAMSIRWVNAGAEALWAGGAALPRETGLVSMIEARLRPGPARARLLAALRDMPGVRIDEGEDIASAVANPLRELGACVWLVGVGAALSTVSALAAIACTARAGIAAGLEKLGAPRRQAVRIALAPLALGGVIGVLVGAALDVVLFLWIRRPLEELGLAGGAGAFWSALIAAPVVVGGNALAIGWWKLAALMRPAR